MDCNQTAKPANLQEIYPKVSIRKANLLLFSEFKKPNLALKFTKFGEIICKFTLFLLYNAGFVWIHFDDFPR